MSDSMCDKSFHDIMQFVIHISTLNKTLDSILQPTRETLFCKLALMGAHEVDSVLLETSRSRVILHQVSVAAIILKVIYSICYTLTPFLLLQEFLHKSF